MKKAEQRAVEQQRAAREAARAAEIAQRCEGFRALGLKGLRPAVGGLEGGARGGCPEVRGLLSFRALQCWLAVGGPGGGACRGGHPEVWAFKL